MHQFVFRWEARAYDDLSQSERDTQMIVIGEDDLILQKSKFVDITRAGQF